MFVCWNSESQVTVKQCSNIGLVAKESKSFICLATIILEGSERGNGRLFIWNNHKDILGRS